MGKITAKYHLSKRTSFLDFYYIFERHTEKKEWMALGICSAHPRRKRIHSTFELSEQKCPNTNHHY